MVVLAGSILATTTTTALTTSAATGAGVGALTGAITGMTSPSTASVGALMAKSAAGAGSAGAIIGSVVGGWVGGVTGGLPTMANAAVGSITAAMSAPVATSLALSGVAGVLSGPVGCLVLGATGDQQLGDATFDCWKPVLHDDSLEPSNGMILRDIADDPRVKEVTAVTNAEPGLPQLILRNIWDEKFRIEYVYLHSSQLAAHAIRI